MLLHPTYFPNVAHFVAALKTDNLTFEVCDNYQKQTFRNRAEVYAANGKLTLTAPVTYSQKQRQLYKDVKIYNTENWQQLHLKSLESAYRMSPFFEFYIDDLLPLFTSKFDFILDFNLKCFDVLLECLQLDINFSLTKTFQKEATNDFRFLVNARTESPFQFKEYTQVFTEKKGYINNLSILDLLFNEGPNTSNYLEAQLLTN